MTPGERLGLLPKLLALTEATETPNPPAGFARLADDILEEGLITERPSEKHFGDHSG